MKKILLSACALLVAGTTFAQTKMATLPNDNMAKGMVNMFTAPTNMSSSSAAPTVIWSDDCSNIATWTITNSSTVPSHEWGLETDPNTIPVSVLSPFASTTASNGYMFISSDANNTVDNDGTTISTEFTNATPIDLTNYPYVQLTFQHNFRWWKDTRSVRVSGDNGATWTEIDEISNNAGYTYPDQNSNNPHMSTYDISAVAGGQSQVLVQFYYNDHDIWAWYWAVDDVAISELPDNLVVSSEEVMGGWWIGYQTSGGLGQDYTYNPISQASVNPYTFESVLKNGGVASQDAVMHVDVVDLANQTSVYTGSSNTITLNTGEQDTVAATTTFTPSAVGSYSVEMWTSADSAGAGIVTTYTDTTLKYTNVTDYIYGKDFNNPNGSWRLSRGTGGFEVGSVFDIFADEDLYSVDAYIADYSVPGAKVYAVLYEYDAAGGDPIYLDQSDDYTVSADGWINIPFLSTQMLTAGTSYVIAIGGYQHPTDTAGVNLSGAGDASVQYLLDKDDAFGNGGATWYTISDIPMLRMNFDPATAWTPSSVNNVESSFNIYPNPTKGDLVIELDEALDAELTINNVLGQVVYTEQVNSSVISLDLSSYEKGVYTIELKNENTTITEKVVVE